MIGAKDMWYNIIIGDKLGDKIEFLYNALRKKKHVSRCIPPNKFVFCLKGRVRSAEAVPAYFSPCWLPDSR